ncbi:carbon-nitrogen hydrolase family protein [Swingsia samuiensis]|uniref:Carbon-nitrogen hydrolase family protein n=1 Tax=Swingsia samuiensis TaxID=1293412 RepID=A0A4Y6ULU6_9PROT|nr:carbon-nitrogen hydrolase family protein [Swingsia samuiensis]QDH17361.1 carbon-nitrogen hydrolase family protein [Swingsia samuiensis]
MRVAVIQMEPSADRDANIAQAEKFIHEASAQGPLDLVVLPEVWNCLGGTIEQKHKAAEFFPQNGEKGGVLYETLKSIAQKYKVWVHGGSIGEKTAKSEGAKLANTSLVFDPDGVEQARYRKIHLFDVVTPNGEGYRESDSYVPGDAIKTVDIANIPTGLAICYDVRFSELFAALRDAGAKMIILPAAFTKQTGKAHWEVMIRARAIETQSWVIACGTTGSYVDGDGSIRETFGHSMIVNPWGCVVLSLGSEPGWGVAELDIDLVSQVRERMPVQENRRLV